MVTKLQFWLTSNSAIGDSRMKANLASCRTLSIPLLLCGNKISDLKGQFNVFEVATSCSTTYLSFPSQRRPSVDKVPKYSSERERQYRPNMYSFFLEVEVFETFWLIWKKREVALSSIHPYSTPCLFSAKAFTELIGRSILKRNKVIERSWCLTMTMRQKTSADTV